MRPHADDWEAACWFPNEAFQWLAQAGYLGLKFPAAYGGRDDPVAAAVLVEELARCGSGGVAAGLGAHAGIALPPILSFGTEEQRRRHLIPGLRGQKIAALAITEPEAGSDVASIRTHARPAPDGYIVNGSKTYITGGVRADVLVTAVRTTPEGGHEGLSFLLIERRAGDGITTNPLRKLGWHASDTAEIAFNDVFVPAEDLLGAEHQGFALIMANFQWERLLMALGAIGAMQVWFERTIDYVKRSPRACGQATRHRLAEVAVEIEAGRAVTYSALRRHVAGPRRRARGHDRQAEDPALRRAGDRHLSDAPRPRRAARARAGSPRRAPGADRRRHRRDHEGDPGALTRPVTQGISRAPDGPRWSPPAAGVDGLTLFRRLSQVGLRCGADPGLTNQGARQ